MGFLRAFLAISVLIAHAREIFSTHGVVWNSIISRENTHIYPWSGHAVFAFFIISGFYMSMVINEKYSKLENGKIKFISNRLLRLYPVNFVLIALYFIFYMATGTKSFLVFNDPNQTVFMTIVAYFCNLFYLGAEIIPFSNESNWSYVIGPVWSLSLELYFYLLAPFIVTKKIKYIAIMAVAGLAIRIAMEMNNIPLTPWRYFFFPSDFVFFILGVISYRTKDFKLKIKGIGLITMIRWASLASLILMLFNEYFWSISGNIDSYSSWAFYACVAISSPLLFEITKKSKIDNYIGQLSYPIYISHMLAIALVYYFTRDGIDRGAASLIVTLSISVMLFHFIDKPIESIRRKIAKNNKGEKNNDLQGKIIVNQGIIKDA